MNQPTVAHIEDDLPPCDPLSTVATFSRAPSTHAPRVLILYGSLREKSFSRYLAEECGRVLTAFGADVRTFDPHGLPVFDRQSFDSPKVRELRELSLWSEAQVWVSPEQHGAMTAAFKNQIDWIPLSDGAVRPTQGRTLAVLQVSGGSQSFNAVNQLRLLGRWMRMFTIPNQSSVPKAFEEFDAAGRMRPSSYRDRVVDVMEELFRFTLLLRDNVEVLSTRYSEEKERRALGALKPALGVAPKE
jgi:arsenic resistance protein ArsH